MSKIQSPTKHLLSALDTNEVNVLYSCILWVKHVQCDLVDDSSAGDQQAALLQKQLVSCDHASDVSGSIGSMARTETERELPKFPKLNGLYAAVTALL